MKKYLSVVSLCTLTFMAGLTVSRFNDVALAESGPTLNAGGVAVLDLPTSSAESIRLDIKDGRFAQQSVGRLVLDANGIDFRNGVLKGLKAEVHDGNFDDILVNQLTLDTSAFSFDTVELLNHRRFMLDKPVTAAVQMKISEDNLNHFLTNPRTLEKLEKAVAKKTANLSLVKFSNPNLDLLGKDKIKLTVMMVLAGAAAAPMEMNGRLQIKDSKLAFRDLKVTSNGTAMPVDIASVFEKKLNEMIDLQRLGKNSFVINARRLKVSSTMLEVEGDAALTRLEFGK